MSRTKWMVLASVTVAAACVTNATGRRQLLLVSEHDEQKLGLSAYEEVLEKAKLSTDEALVTRVERVGRRVATAANRPDFQWEFKLIEDEAANAFCLPGGKIAVYTGLLPFAQNDHALAAVLGHEVAHAILRHGGERMSHTILAQLGDQAIAAGMANRDPQVVNVVRGVYGIGAQVGVLMPFSREHELEADRMGLMLMAKAGYRPEEAIHFWERMSAAGGAQPPVFLSTHPSHESRIAELRRALPETQKAYRPQ